MANGTKDFWVRLEAVGTENHADEPLTFLGPSNTLTRVNHTGRAIGNLHQKGAMRVRAGNASQLFDPDDTPMTDEPNARDENNRPATKDSHDFSVQDNTAERKARQRNINCGAIKDASIAVKAHIKNNVAKEEADQINISCPSGFNPDLLKALEYLR